MSVGTIRVTSHGKIPDPRAWDAVVAASAAPVFYRSSILAAYGARPLQPTLDARYLIARAGDTPVAVLPLYLVPARDPFGAAAGHKSQTWAISHFWHCYDTRLPCVSVVAPVVIALWEAVAGHARDWGAARFGLINVAARGPESSAFAQIQAHAVPRSQRYRIALAGARDFGEYIARLPRDIRQDARRQLRRAQRAGVTCHVHRPPLPPEVIGRVCELLELTAEKYNPGYYESGPVAHFLTNAGPALRILVLEAGSRVIAASVSFHDGDTLHNWAIGVEPAAAGAFSPYLVLLELSMQYAIAQGCEVIEMGRTNPGWKQRVGAGPVDLTSWMNVEGA
jgi:hypothetical protein